MDTSVICLASGFRGYGRKARRFALVLFGAPALMLPVAHPQAMPIAKPKPITVCPGGFPTDLNDISGRDCGYTQGARTVDFLSGSVTDQAVLGAVVFGLGAQIIQSPSEWKRTWEGYGRRVGSRYTQAVGKGAAQYIVGSIVRDDPRPLAYRNEPHLLAARYKAVSEGNTGAVLAHDGWQRFGHAWFDVITVRRSSVEGNGHRIPAISRFAGEFAGAYAGYPWYPAAENTFPKVGARAAGAFGTAVLSSFYNEYKPEITKLLGAIMQQGRQKSSAQGGHS